MNKVSAAERLEAQLTSFQPQRSKMETKIEKLKVKVARKPDLSKLSHEDLGCHLQIFESYVHQLRPLQSRIEERKCKADRIISIFVEQIYIKVSANMVGYFGKYLL